MVDEIRIIDDPKVIKLVIDETRRAILDLLRLNNLTVGQMANILEKDQSTIYRHVEKLLKAGIIAQTGEKKVHHIPEKVYGRTAKIFFLAPGVDAVPEKDVLLRRSKKSSEVVAEILEQLGYSDGSGQEKLVREAFVEIEKAVSDKMKSMKSDANINFYTIWKLQTAITILEMEKNPKLRASIKRFTDSYL